MFNTPKMILPNTVAAFLATVALLLSSAYSPAAAQSSDETPDETTKMTHYSLYYEDFKAGNYADALDDLTWLLENAPTYAGPGKNDARNFERAIVTYDSLAARAGDEAQTRAHLETALALFDQAVSTLKDEGLEVDEAKWTLNKGRFIKNHTTELPDLQDEGTTYFQQAYQMDPEGIDSYYVKVLISTYAQRDKAEAVSFMDEVEARFGEDEDLMNYLAQIRDALFRTPEERMAFLESQLEKKPDDVKIVNELFDIYQELGHRNKMYEIGERLMAMEPSANTYRILGKLRLDDGQPQEAVELYEKAIDLDGQATVLDYFNMGIAQQQMGSLAKARTYFRQALDLDSGYGNAYIAIGDLYATAVSECGSFEREDQAVYWLAVDYYNKAKNADASVASAANRKIQTYRRSFPDQEAMFFKNWEAGQSYRIDYGCYSWINETTTVKSQ